MKIEILGKLTVLYLPVSKTRIIPFVGFTITEPYFRPHQLEVQFLIETPVAEFLKPSTRQEKLKILVYNKKTRLVIPPLCHPERSEGSSPAAGWA